MAIWGASHMPRAAVVHSLYSCSTTRSAIAQAVCLKHGDQIWQLILAAIAAGFVKRNDYVCHRTRAFLLRILFPEGRRHRNRYSFFHLDLTDPIKFQFVQSVIFPVALANRDAVIANPDCLEQLVQDRLVVLQSAPALPQPTLAPMLAPSLPPVIIKQTEVETVTETTTKTVTRTKTIEIRHDPIVMYDFVLWPRPITSLPYTWEQARAATWLFRDMHVPAELGGKPGLTAKAMHLRFALRAWRGRADERVLTLIKGIISAMEFNPNGKCEWPIKPLREEW